jgi:hypothetical protein
MTPDEKKQIKEVMETLKELEKLLDDRIADFYEIKGTMQARHAYCYYRSYVWKSQYALRDILQKEIKEQEA